MDAHNTLQLLLDANTRPDGNLYPAPARPPPLPPRPPKPPSPPARATRTRTPTPRTKTPNAPATPPWPATCPTGTAWPPPRRTGLDHRSAGQPRRHRLHRHVPGRRRTRAGDDRQGAGRLYELELSADRMAARSHPAAAQGRPSIALQTVRANAGRPGHRHGLLETELAEAVEQGRTGTLLVAQGAPAAQHPTRFEACWTGSSRAPGNRRTGTGGLPRPGQPAAGAPGTPLMRRIPRCPASMAATCWSQPVLPTRWPTRNSPATCPASRSIRTTRCCCARRSPAAPLINQGVQVNPVVEVDAVDLTTGNINFEGSLRVGATSAPPWKCA